MNVAETILVFVGAPLAIVLLLVLLVFVPGGRRRPRYRPGQPWEHAPVWYEPHPQATGDDGATSHVRSRAVPRWRGPSAAPAVRGDGRAHPAPATSSSGEVR